MLCLASAADASIIYDVNRTIGDGTVTGFIETDGMLGILESVHITDWSLTLTSPNLLGGSPDVITAAIGLVFIGGTDLTATSTDLFFDFSGSGFLLLEGDGVGGRSINYWCLQVGASCATGLSFGVEIIGRDNILAPAQVASRSGTIAIASIHSVPVVPLPAALPLFGTGLALLGFMGWRKRRAADA